MTTYIVLRSGEVEGVRKTALVSEDTYENNPAEYFVAPFDKGAKKVGEVDIDGDTSQLDYVYVSDD